MYKILLVEDDADIREVICDYFDAKSEGSITIDTAISGQQGVEKVYKTLVTQGNSKNYYVFVIPIAEELDMKKAAKSVGEKSVAMLHVKDINAVTGYIRGGCTAIGMKKQYITRIEQAAKNLEQIIVSGGKHGTQLELAPDDLCKASNAEYADITVK